MGTQPGAFLSTSHQVRISLGGFSQAPFPLETSFFFQVAGILKSFRLNDLGWQASSSHLLTHDLG